MSSSTSVSRGLATLGDIASRVLRVVPRVLLRSALAGGLVGAGIGLLLPKRFSSEASFVVQQKRTGVSVASLVQQIGLSVGEGDVLGGSFYVDLTKTDVILRAVERAPVLLSSGEKVSVAEYLRVRGASEAQREEEAIAELRDRLDVSFNNKSGIIRVGFVDSDSLVVAAIVSRVPKELDLFNRTRRRSQARAEREFLEARTKGAADSLFAAEEELRRFREVNRLMMSSPGLQLEQDRLTRRLTIRNSVYQTLIQNLEQARIEEVRDTPVLSLVDEPQPPARPRSRYVSFLALLGAVLGASIVLARRLLVTGVQASSAALSETA